MFYTFNIIAIGIVVIAWIVKIYEWTTERKRIKKLNEPVRTNFVFTWNDVWDFPKKEVIVEKEVEIVKEVEVEKKVKVRSMMSPFKAGIFRMFNYDDYTWILFINDWAVGEVTFLEDTICLNWFNVIIQSDKKDDEDIGSILDQNRLKETQTHYYRNTFDFMDALTNTSLDTFRERYQKMLDTPITYAGGWTIYPNRIESNVSSSGTNLTVSNFMSNLRT